MRVWVINLVEVWIVEEPLRVDEELEELILGMFFTMEFFHRECWSVRSLAMLEGY